MQRTFAASDGTAEGTASASVRVRRLTSPARPPSAPAVRRSAPESYPQVARLPPIRADRHPNPIRSPVEGSANNHQGACLTLGAFSALIESPKKGLILPKLERRSDVGKLALNILDRVNASLQYPKRFTQETLSRLESFS